MLLVLGAGGQIGRELIERAGDAALGLAEQECDICDTTSVARATSAAGLSAVVNCAAYTAVDRAESERERAFAARTAAARGLPIIHLSTDYVYVGTKASPYREDDPVAPINVYGASKAAGDSSVRAENPAHVMLRVSWVFGVYGTNFVKTMLRLGRERRELRVVADQIGGPTEARDIADAILTMKAACCRPGFSAWGTYHFAGAPSTSWHEFADAIFSRARPPVPRLVAIDSQDYPTPAARPRYSTLDCGRIRRVFNLEQADRRISLWRVLSELGEAATH
jgi:dTDP-4-dehydrorhamnose reductase